MGTVAQMNEAAEEVTEEDVDDVPVPNDRPRRINTGKGIEILKMDFQVKSKRECNFITNSASTETKGEAGNSPDSYMKLACDSILTQMKAKQYSAKAVAAMIKEFTKLNEVAVPGKLVVVPTDSNSLTTTEKSKSLRAINLTKEKWNGHIKGLS